MPQDQELTPDMSLVEAVRVALSRPRWILVYPLMAALLAFGATYLIAPLYTSTVAFAPERLSSSGQPAGLSGLAGEFGLNVLMDVGRTPAYYISVLDSRQIREQVLRSRVTRDSVPVLSLLRVKRGTTADSIAAGVRALGAMTLIKQDINTAIIRLSVETVDPALSAQVAMHYVDALNRFNAEQRQSQARERRRFIEARIAVAQRALQDGGGSPRRPRLAIDAEAAREAYLTLQREYELARIEEVTDTPVLTIIDPAVPPLSRSRPRRNVAFLGVFAVGILVGLLATFAAEYVHRARARDPEGFAKLSRPWRR